MRIKTRLLLLACGSSVICGLALFLYSILLSPIDVMQREQRLLQNVADANRDLQIQVNRLMSEPIAMQAMAFEVAVEKYGASLDSLDGIAAITRADAAMKAAVASIISLREGSRDPIQELRESLDEVRKEVVRVHGKVKDPGSFDDPNVFWFYAPSKDPATQESLNGAINRIGVLSGRVNSLTAFLAATISLIQDNAGLIDTEIRNIRVKGLLVILLSLSSALAILLSVSLLIARSIALVLRRIAAHVSTMKEGDFTRRLGLAGADEASQLSRDLDSLLETLGRSLRSIQRSSQENLHVRGEMLESVGKAGTSATEIGANSDSISQRMIRMDALLAGSSRDMERVSASLGDFRERITLQNRHVEESVAAVTQMIAAIGNISRISQQDKQAADDLVGEAERGRLVFEETFMRIDEISGSVDAIKEMAEVIADIAAQTNLLSMNAAIEAAHAGQYGRGFAVVAGEIGKLATASSSNSQKISRTIRSVIDRISGAGESSGTTARAFEQISRRITTVSESVADIDRTVLDMQAGSRQILEAMTELREGSAAIAEESRQLDSRVRSVHESMTDLGCVSGEVVSNIGEIALGLQTISGIVGTIDDQAERIGRIGLQLDTEIRRFKTTDPEP